MWGGVVVTVVHSNIKTYYLFQGLQSDNRLSFYKSLRSWGIEVAIFIGLVAFWCSVFA